MNLTTIFYINCFIALFGVDALFFSPLSSAVTHSRRWPVMTFVTCGYEHSVASMYILMTGLMYQDSAHPAYSFTFGDVILRNLIPATLGNIVGGAIFVTGLFAFVHREPSTEASVVSKIMRRLRVCQSIAQSIYRIEGFSLLFST